MIGEESRTDTTFGNGTVSLAAKQRSAASEHRSWHGPLRRSRVRHQRNRAISTWPVGAPPPSMT